MTTLSNWYYKARKQWTVGPITVDGDRISGISAGTMVCKWYSSYGTLVATVSGVYAEVDGEDFFSFDLGSDDQANFVEGGEHSYEHVLTVSGQDYIKPPGRRVDGWVGTATALSRYSDS